MNRYCCPSCGGFIGEAAPIGEIVDQAIRSPWQRAVIRSLSSPVGKTVRRERIVSAVYAASGDTAPLTADNSLSAIIRNTRNALEPFGWTIVTRSGGRGNFGTYTLTPLEAGA